MSLNNSSVAQTNVRTITHKEKRVRNLSLRGDNAGRVGLEGKTAAAWSFFLRKTKSELPVSGWSTDCGEREGGGGREEKGVRIPALAVQPNSRALCGTPRNEHGVQFCHRPSARSEREGKRHGEAILKRDKSACEEEAGPSPSECVCQKEKRGERERGEKEGRLYWKPSLSRSWDPLSCSSPGLCVCLWDHVWKFNAEDPRVNLR